MAIHTYVNVELLYDWNIKSYMHGLCPCFKLQVLYIVVVMHECIIYSTDIAQPTKCQFGNIMILPSQQGYIRTGSDLIYLIGNLQCPRYLPTTDLQA